jgi:hypothetical protein
VLLKALVINLKSDIGSDKFFERYSLYNEVESNSSEEKP